MRRRIQKVALTLQEGFGAVSSTHRHIHRPPVHLQPRTDTPHAHVAMIGVGSLVIGLWPYLLCMLVVWLLLKWLQLPSPYYDFNKVMGDFNDKNLSVDPYFFNPKDFPWVRFSSIRIIFHCTAQQSPAKPPYNTIKRSTMQQNTVQHNTAYNNATSHHIAQ